MSVYIKRVYEPPQQADGERILVDRVWPRGLSRDKAAVNRWMKEIAPSSGLRKWFGHRPDRWDQFRQAYLEELAQHEDAHRELRRLCRRAPVTLLFAARDERHNNAVVIREWLGA